MKEIKYITVLDFIKGEIKKLEFENAHIQEQLLWEENYMDSLERVILDLKFEHERN